MTDLALARCFGRAASSYDAATHVQPRAARCLLRQVQGLSLSAGISLDLGCATAAIAPDLQAAFPEQVFVGVDIAVPMLQQARLLGRWGPRYRLLCADASRLPIASHSVALAFSSFALQWLKPTDALTEIARVLMPGGVLALALPLAGSLAEMRTSWQAVDGEPRLNRLPALAEWLDAAEQAGFAVETVQQQPLREYAADAITLLRRIKDSGAQHRTDAAPTLSSRRRFSAFAQAYEQFRDAAGLPMSWQVGYLICRPRA